MYARAAKRRRFGYRRLHLPLEREAVTLDWKKLYRLVESFQGRLRDECLTASIGAVIAADQKLGGLCDWVEAEAPRTFDLPVEGAVSLKEAVIPVVLHYSRAGPLCWLRP